MGCYYCCKGHGSKGGRFAKCHFNHHTTIELCHCLSVYVSLWKPLMNGQCRTKFVNYWLWGGSNISTKMSFLFQSSKPSVSIPWICWVDWRNPRTWLWEITKYCLLYNYVVANYSKFVAMVKRDEYGFTLVNFERLLPLSTELFAFPMHVNQVFLQNISYQQEAKR